MNRTSGKRVLVVAVCAALGAGALRLAGGAPALAAGGTDWPQWRGPNRDAVGGSTGLKHSWEGSAPKLAWQAAGLGAGFSSVSIAGDRIYTMGDIGADQFVIALSRTEGKLLWKARVGPQFDDEMPGPRSTPTVDGDRVYALGTEGDLVCVDAATGKVRWAKNLEKQYGGRVMTVWKWSESPLVDEDRLVFTPGGPWAAMVAVDKLTGKDLWATEEMPNLGERGRDGAGYSSIVISNGAGVKQYVQLMGRGLVGIRARDGKFLWGYNRVANNVANISTPIVQGDLVFAATGYQTGAALVKLEKSGDGVKASEVYFIDSKSFQNHHGGMVLVDGHIYAGHGHNNGFPICIDLATGKVVWGGDTRGPGSNSAAVMYADGDLYFRYQNGVMALIEAAATGYKLKGSFQIPQPTPAKPSWSHPVVVDGKLYLREQDKLYVYDVKA
jgi:outer membrane protein assembly factor BamB